MPPCPHTAAVICHSWDEAPFISAGCSRLTSLLDGHKRGCRKPGYTRGLPPPPPRAPGKGASSWKAIPAWDTDPEALARGGPSQCGPKPGSAPSGPGDPRAQLERGPRRGWLCGT